MSLINRKKVHKPFLTARQVAERIGGISAKTVSNRQGITKDLTRYALGSHYGYDVDQVDALVERIRKEAEDQERRTQDLVSKHLRAVN